MKPFFVLSIIVVTLTFATGCTDTGADAPDAGLPGHLGRLALSFASAPPEIEDVIARITREGHNALELHLTISDTTHSASGTFSDVPAGLWHLTVNALDSTGTVRYSGETDVNVLPGQVSHVSLHLDPTSGGGIEIIVTWGNGGNNLLMNGSFEVGPLIGTYLTLYPGSTELPGWVVTRGPMDYVRFWQNAHGERSVDLNGSPGLGGIKQAFPTVIGRTYRVRFAFAGNPEGAPVIKTLGVGAAGQSTQFTFSVSGKSIYNMGWELKTWQFEAVDTQTELEFYSLDNSPTYYGPAIDNVSVEAII